MRALPKLLSAAAALSTCFCASCGSTAPVPLSVTGHWTGSAVVGPEQWNFDANLVQATDSVRGQATVRSVPARFTEAFVVTGIVSGDSVQLLLRPIEDADIHIVAGIAPTRLTGRMWLNMFTAEAHAIVFERQSGP